MGNKIGTSLPQQQPASYGRTDSGRYCVVPFEGLTQSQVDALTIQAELYGLNYHVTGSHGKYKLEVQYNYNFVPKTSGGTGNYPDAQTEVEDLWELSPNTQTKSLLDSRNPLVLLCSKAEISTLAGWKNDGTLKEKMCNADGTIKAPVKLDDGATSMSNYACQIGMILLQGVDMVEIDQPTLTHTKTVTDQYIGRATFTNINRIFSSQTLIAQEGVPATLLFDFPQDTDPSPILIGSPNGTALYQTYGYGWRKKAFPVRQVGGRKWQIQMAWEYGLWLLNIYGAKL